MIDGFRALFVDESISKAAAAFVVSGSEDGVFKRGGLARGNGPVAFVVESFEVASIVFLSADAMKELGSLRVNGLLCRCLSNISQTMNNGLIAYSRRLAVPAEFGASTPPIRTFVCDFALAGDRASRDTDVDIGEGVDPLRTRFRMTLSRDLADLGNVEALFGLEKHKRKSSCKAYTSALIPLNG